MDRGFILDHFKGGQLYSFIGAGGKTSCIRHVAEVLEGEGFRVLISTSTKLGVDEFDRYETSITDEDGLLELVRRRDETGIRVIIRGVLGPKCLGFGKEAFEALGRIPLGTILLLEADGSRRKSFKVPYPHEPVVPANSSRVFLLFSGRILGERISEDNTYNLEGVREILGDGEQFYTADNLRRSLEGGWLEDADLSRLHLLVSAGDRIEKPFHFRNLLRGLHERYGIPASVISTRNQEVLFHLGLRIGAVILAAGESSRMGMPKQLLPLGDTCFLEQAIRLYGAHAHELVVAIGYYKEQIRKEIPEKGFRYLEVEGYAEGMGASLKESVQSLGPVDLFMTTNCDLPLLEPHTLSLLLKAYGRCPGHIVVPRFGGRNGHPVLFPASLIDRFHELEGDEGGRRLIREPGTVFIDLEDPGIVLDIDTYEEYLKIKEAF